jgi:hypothetical protein
MNLGVRIPVKRTPAVMVIEFTTETGITVGMTTTVPITETAVIITVMNGKIGRMATGRSELLTIGMVVATTIARGEGTTEAAVIARKDPITAMVALRDTTEKGANDSIVRGSIAKMAIAVAPGGTAVAVTAANARNVPIIHQIITEDLPIITAEALLIITAEVLLITTEVLITTAGVLPTITGGLTITEVLPDITETRVITEEEPTIIAMPKGAKDQDAAYQPEIHTGEIRMETVVTPMETAAVTPMETAVAAMAIGVPVIGHGGRDLRPAVALAITDNKAVEDTRARIIAQATMIRMRNTVRRNALNIRNNS